MIQLIASISINNKTAGYRFLDTKSKKILDVPTANVKQALEKGNKLEGIEISTSGSLSGTNGSLERYPILNKSKNKIEKSKRVIILNRIVTDSNECIGYTISDYKGTVKTIKNDDLIKYILKNNSNIANGKLVNNDGYFISAISGEYELQKVGSTKVKKSVTSVKETKKEEVVKPKIEEIAKPRIEDNVLADKDTMDSLLKELLKTGVYLNSDSNVKIAVNKYLTNEVIGGKSKLGSRSGYSQNFKEYLQSSKYSSALGKIPFLNLVKFLTDNLIKVPELNCDIGLYLVGLDKVIFDYDNSEAVFSYDENNFIVRNTWTYKGSKLMLAIYYIVLNGKTSNVLCQEINGYNTHRLYEKYRMEEIELKSYAYLSEFIGVENLYVNLGETCDAAGCGRIKYKDKIVKDFNVIRLLKVGDMISGSNDVMRLNGKNVTKSKFIFFDYLAMFNLIPVGGEANSTWVFDMCNRRYIKFSILKDKNNQYDGWKVDDIIDYESVSNNAELSSVLSVLKEVPSRLPTILRLLGNFKKGDEIDKNKTGENYGDYHSIITDCTSQKITNHKQLLERLIESESTISKIKDNNETSDDTYIDKNLGINYMNTCYAHELGVPVYSFNVTDSAKYSGTYKSMAIVVPRWISKFIKLINNEFDVDDMVILYKIKLNKEVTISYAIDTNGFIHILSFSDYEWVDTFKFKNFKNALMFMAQSMNNSAENNTYEIGYVGVSNLVSEQAIQYFKQPGSRLGGIFTDMQGNYQYKDFSADKYKYDNIKKLVNLLA